MISEHGGTHLTSWAQELVKVSVRGGTDGPVRGVACGDALGSVFAVAVGTSLKLVKCESRKLAARVYETLNAHGSGGVLAVAMHGDVVVSGGADGDVRVWRLLPYTDVLCDAGDAHSPLKLVMAIDAHSGCAIVDLVLSVDGKTLVTSAKNGHCAVWRLGVALAEIKLRNDKSTAELTPERRVSLPVDVTCVALSHDASLFAVGASDGKAYVFGRKSGHENTNQEYVMTCEHVICGDVTSTSSNAAITSLAFGVRRTSSVLATANENGNVDTWTLGDLINVTTRDTSPFGIKPGLLGQHTAKFNSHSGNVTSLCFAELGEVLCTVGGEGSCKLWRSRPTEVQFNHRTREGDCTLGNVARSLSIGGAPCGKRGVLFVEKALRVVTVTSKGTLKVWGIPAKGNEAGLVLG